MAVARDSLPEEVDKLERAKLQLEIELHAIRGELAKNKKDEVAKQKIEELESNISKINEELGPIMARFQAEKSKSDEIQSVKQRIDDLKAKAADAERRYDLATAADIVHGALPDLTARLQTLEAQKRDEDAAKRAGGEESLAGDVVLPEHIQAIVANWSGVPVQSLRVSVVHLSRTTSR